MKLVDVKKRAKKLDIKIVKMSKKDIILAIQRAEGNFPCFQTAGEYCDQFGCVWRDDCLGKNK
jgi:hypothetical protein